MDAWTDTLYLTVRISTFRRVLVLAVYSMAAVICAALTLHRLWLLVALWLPIGVGFRNDWRAAGLLSVRSIQRLRWHPEGGWYWQTGDGHWHRGECISGSSFGTSLVLLTLRPEGARWLRARVTLFSDALDATSHRRLRARIRVAPPSQK